MYKTVTVLLFGRAVPNRPFLHLNLEPNWQRQRSQTNANQNITICYLQDILENVVGCVWQKWAFNTEQTYLAKQVALENHGPLEGWPAPVRFTPVRRKTKLEFSCTREEGAELSIPSFSPRPLWPQFTTVEDWGTQERLELSRENYPSGNWKSQEEIYNPPKPTQTRVNPSSVASRCPGY